MWILYLYFTAFGDEHIKMQSMHDTKQECIKAAIVAKHEMPDSIPVCLEMI